jgi:signal transduction histidine kinase
MIDEPGDLCLLKVPMQQKLAAMQGMTDHTIHVVRYIASELRPSILDDLGLIEAIEWQAQQFQTRTGVECRCQCAAQSIALSQDQSTAVFRIFQEALTNILRHAHASRVEVAMEERENAFVLTVTDNGRGISQEEKLRRSSVGILGMQERARLVGGKVEIRGKRGCGTKVRVRVPFAEQELEAADGSRPGTA